MHKQIIMTTILTARSGSLTQMWATHRAGICKDIRVLTEEKKNRIVAIAASRELFSRKKQKKKKKREHLGYFNKTPTLSFDNAGYSHLKRQYEQVSRLSNLSPALHSYLNLSHEYRQTCSQRRRFRRKKKNIGIYGKLINSLVLEKSRPPYLFFFILHATGATFYKVMNMLRDLKRQSGAK